MQALFEEALALAPDERAPHLERTVADEGLRREVMALLVAHERGEGAFRSPVSASVLLDAVTGDDRWIGRRLGAYRVEALVGLGGMGAVYEARRADHEYDKRVAVKFLHRHAGSADALRRFRAERQILANLNHPNIATLVDGGVTDDGQPYLVMEYIEGQPITRWCDGRSLPIPERVRLMLQVCAAVQSAHQGLVVHRDLKPGNILVSADGRVKLLDFGIARLLSPDGDAAEPATLVGQRSFTPEYASPEQVRGLPVGTSADVYALGVVLFELVSGRRPFDLAGKLLNEMERIVCEVLPPRAVADADLDAIIQKALRKEPERRYGSAELLEQDLQRWLEGRPVLARPEGAGYRFRKLIRRRKLESAAIAMAVLSMVGGLFATARQARRAEAQGRRAEQVTSFLTTMLGSADPALLGRDVTVRAVLDSAALKADTLRSDPLLEAEVRGIIGSTYVALGEFETGEAQLGRAVEAHWRATPAGSNETAVALSRQAHAVEYLGRLAAADSLVRRAAALLERFPHADPLDRVDFLDQQARLLSRLGDNAAAAPLLAQALEITVAVAPGNDSALAYAAANLGQVESELGRKARAESLYVVAVGAARRAYGDVHPVTASVLSPYATVLERSGKAEQADTTYREVLAIRRSQLGAAHPEYAWTMCNYADFLVENRRYPEAAVWARRVLALRDTTLPDTHMAVSKAMLLLGSALGPMDSLAAAERWLRAGLALRRETLPPGHWLLASTEGTLGAHYTLAGRYQEAESLLVPAERRLVELRGEQAPIVATARTRLVDLYAAWGKPDEARAWKAKIP